MARERKGERGGGEDRGAQARVRPFWSGTLSFGLVSVPVDLYPAVRSRRVGLRMLDDKGTPLERRYYDPGTGRTVPGEDLVRGWEAAEDEYVVVEEEELEELAPEKSRDIDLRRFVPVDELDPLFFRKAYFLAPSGGSTKAYRLLARAMERSGRAGIATFVMRGVEYLAAVLAEEGVLRLETLRFQDEVRTPEDVGLEDGRKAPAARVRSLRSQIRKLAADELDEGELEDAWTERLEALVDRKRRAGRGVVEAPEAEAAEALDVKVIDLLEVLKRSMREAGGRKTGAGVRGGEGGRRTRGRRAAGARGRGGAAADLESMTKEELYQRAKELDVPGRSSMTKEELARAIREAA